MTTRDATVALTRSARWENAPVDQGSNLVMRSIPIRHWHRAFHLENLMETLSSCRNFIIIYHPVSTTQLYYIFTYIIIIKKNLIVIQWTQYYYVGIKTIFSEIKIYKIRHRTPSYIYVYTYKKNMNINYSGKIPYTRAWKKYTECWRWRQFFSYPWTISCRSRSYSPTAPEMTVIWNSPEMHAQQLNSVVCVLCLPPIFTYLRSENLFNCTNKTTYRAVLSKISCVLVYLQQFIEAVWEKINKKKRVKRVETSVSLCVKPESTGRAR